jgi:hypothetical protein
VAFGCVFVVSLMHTLLQRLSPAVVHLQEPPVHWVPVGHAVGALAELQAPQLRLSV